MSAAKITEKTTKKDMLAYIKTIQKQLAEEKASVSVDKKAALKIVEDKKTVKSAQETSVEDIIKTFRVQINGALSGFEEQLLTKKNKLDEVQKAIKIEEQRLKDVYDIQNEADTLQVLLRAHEQERQEFLDLKENERLEWKKEQEENNKWIKEREAQLKKEWDRKLEEHTYEWKLKKSREQDAFAEEKKLKERELNELTEKTLKALEVRERAIEASEDELIKLKEKVAKIDEEQLSAVNVAVEKALKSEKTSRHFEVSTLKRDHESTVKVLQNLNTTLAQQVDVLTKENADIKNKLETAYGEIRNIAKEAIQGASQAKVVVTQDSKPVTK